MEREAFPNYTQIEPVAPAALWWVLRGLTLALTLYLIFLLFTDAQSGLYLFWLLLIPLLPLSFAIVPGLWRNICPMALLNQLPRQFGFSRELTLPPGGRRVALYLSVIAFFVFILLRHPLLNHSGFYLGLTLLAALLLAFVGGVLFKGRSGWCGTFCPLAPLQKAYGHAPLLLVRNGYCKTCLGCQKNCYDFNPRAAFFSDIDDSEPEWSEQRRFFIAFLPGLIAAFFEMEYQAAMPLLDYLRAMLVPPLISMGIFYLLHNLLHVNYFRLASIYAMAALVIFYWYGVQLVNAGLQRQFDIALSDTQLFWTQYAVVAVGVVVVLRSLVSERHYRLSKQSTAKASVGKGVVALKSALEEVDADAAVTERASGRQMPIPAGQTLLDALEANDMPIMPGCRMGMCGSDPVVIVEGMDNLDPPDENELNTLKRLGLEGKARLACCCRPRADIEIDLDADPTEYTAFGEGGAQAAVPESDRPRVIIIGNGIAGISTAETLRAADRDRDIVIISAEPYHFYNRMGLEAVLYGRTAMQGLFLLKEEWYQLNRIDTWLNTQVTEIDPPNHQITLGTGERVDYDKLVLATGADAFVPEDEGFHLPGVFTLRSAEDALTIRRWVQQHGSNRAVVLGGGVLGVEAAEALAQMDMRVTIVHQAEHLMNRQIDRHAAVILKTFLDNKGTRVVTGSGIRTIAQSGELLEVLLADGRVLITDIVLLCIGVRANTRLARAAGLDVRRGVVVDSRMRSSDPDIYCVGDAAELPGAVGGLWPVGSEQGKIAAASMLGGGAGYTAQAMPPVQLKVKGIDLKCFGRFEEGDEVQSLTDGDPARHTWKHLCLRDGKLIGGVFVNAPLGAMAAIKAARTADAAPSAEELEEILRKDRQGIKKGR